MKNLVGLAKKYLSTQATSVTSDIVFGRSGNVITDDNRASLTSEQSEQLIFLALNRNYIPKYFIFY